jgi:hypothetical protein
LQDGEWKSGGSFMVKTVIDLLNFLGVQG